MKSKIFLIGLAIGLSGCVSERRYRRDMDGMRTALAQIRQHTQDCESESYNEFSGVSYDAR